LIITCAALGLLRSAARFKNPADADPLAIAPPRAGHSNVHVVNDAMWRKFTAT
jgi:hypothetical protein